MSTEISLFHIATDADANAYTSAGIYRCASLETEGFIHCCNRIQLIGVTERYYETVDDVQLLLLDADKLESALILENTVGGTELFPHIYGPINGAAIIDIVPFGIHSTERLGLFL